MTEDNGPITFTLMGQRQAAGKGAASRTRAGSGAAAAGAADGADERPVSFSVRPAAASRAGATRHTVQALPGRDVVALHIEGGPVLYLHPEHARALMLAQASGSAGGAAGGVRGRSAGPSAPASGEGAVEVPMQLGWPGLLPGAGGTSGGAQAATWAGTQAGMRAGMRAGGWVGKVVLAAFEILGRRPGSANDDPQDTAARRVASVVVAAVDRQVNAGVYALAPERLQPLKAHAQPLASVPAAGPADGPLLVFIHGTFSETAGTFGKLWKLHPEQVRALFRFYGGRVYALDHPTLGASPVANALTLVSALPQGARLHLATHSRGGLVAEVLARVATEQPEIGPADLAPFAGHDFDTWRQELQALAAAVRAKGIRVERVLRVACPARGTLLASRRLDAYISVLKWGLQLAGVPVAPALVEFAIEVARCRADAKQMPGLAAMLPDSPLVQWLNGAPEPVPGELRVLAGDQQGDGVVSWLKTLLADAYYWTDNDLVVQTRSMYGGAPRTGGALYLLERSGKTNHFNYFANERSVQALVQGLTESRPAGFAPIGPLSWAGTDASGLRAAARLRGAAAADPAKPAVFLLPGILGSNLAADGKRIWLSLRLIGGLSKLRWRGGEGGVADDGVRPDGPIGMIYDKLVEHLGTTHEVIEFGYDWRRPIEEEARRLADAVETAMNAREQSGQPVRLLAHSMGGVLVRTMWLERAATFERLMQHPRARFVMLGTPNGGSWAPMQVLSGDDTFGNVLAAFGSPLSDWRARQTMAEMPGFLQLQAGLLDAKRGLGEAETWKRIAEADVNAVHQLNWWHRAGGEREEAAYEWGLPTQAALDQAVTLRQRLDQQREQELGAFADKMCLVVGRAERTPVDYVLDAERGLEYLDADDGDGRVPIASALLPGVRTWLAPIGHGDLASKRSAFDAYVELLESGETVRLARLPATRGASDGGGTAATAAPTATTTALKRSRPSRMASAPHPAGETANLFAPADAAPTDASAQEGAGGDTAPPLQITVLNGNLSFVAAPLIVGHYRAAALSGTEAVVDRLIGGAMCLTLIDGNYPEAPGSQQVFVNVRRDPGNPWQAPKPRSVIVVGLGEEGHLNERDIVMSVRQGVLAWAQRLAEAEPGAVAVPLELAATLLGSGGIGISAAAAATAVARGVREAQERLSASARLGHEGGAMRLTLVELYLDRASEAWQGLRLLATAQPHAFALAGPIAAGTGPLRRRLDEGYRGADYDLITITQGSTQRSTQGNTQGNTQANKTTSLNYALDTRRARTEVRAQHSQGSLVRELVARAAQEVNDDPQIGRTLFQLLVPVEVEPFLGSSERVVLELDSSSAPIPWELLDTGAAGADPRPWALRTGLLRRLRKEQFRSQPRDAHADDAVLIVGEPAVDPARYGPLPGARAEAAAVVAQLSGAGALEAGRLNALLDQADAASVLRALLARPYRIVHIAGHGEPPQAEGGGGVVLSGGHFLGAREIRSMRTVPELVFVNCCHLADLGAGQLLKTPDPAAFAAGVADALIEIGVRCVVAAGWAVEDGPAEDFAAAFYRELMAGRSFSQAVAAGREAAYAANPAGKTWAAYQCYGDPDWTYRSSTGDAQAPTPLLTSEYDAIASAPALTLALEELMTRKRWMGAALREQRERLAHLEARFGAGGWGDIGAVAEAFALAWLECEDPERALAWYERALRANDGSATQRALEQALNLRVRVAASRVQAGRDVNASTGGTSRGASGVNRGTGTASEALVAKARAEIEAALAELQVLAKRQPTAERGNLLGSAYKRLAVVEAIAGQRAAEITALERARAAYSESESQMQASRPQEIFYPALNRLAIEQVLAVREGRSGAAWDGQAAARIRESLQAKQQQEPDFWSHVCEVELRVHEALTEGHLATRLPQLTEAYADIAMRIEAPWLWASVADQALFVLGPLGVQQAGGETERAARELLAQLQRLANRPEVAGTGAADSGPVQHGSPRDGDAGGGEGADGRDEVGNRRHAGTRGGYGAAPTRSSLSARPSRR